MKHLRLADSLERDELRREKKERLSGCPVEFLKGKAVLIRRGGTEEAARSRRASGRCPDLWEHLCHFGRGTRVKKVEEKALLIIVRKKKVPLTKKKGLRRLF